MICCCLTLTPSSFSSLFAPRTNLLWVAITPPSPPMFNTKWITHSVMHYDSVQIILSISWRNKIFIMYDIIWLLYSFASIGSGGTTVFYLLISAVSAVSIWEKAKRPLIFANKKLHKINNNGRDEWSPNYWYSSSHISFGTRGDGKVKISILSLYSSNISWM